MDCDLPVCPGFFRFSAKGRSTEAERVTIFISPQYSEITENPVRVFPYANFVCCQIQYDHLIRVQVR
jgi:hypothetical protein